MTLKSAPDNNPPPLTFPALTFAKLAPTSFLLAHLTSPRGAHRASGRTPTQTRTPTCHTGSLTHANGSAVVRCGDTAVVCGVRAETLRIEDCADYQSRKQDFDGDDDGQEEDGNINEEDKRNRRREDTEEIAHLNLLVPNLELATGCSPAHLPGGPPSALAQMLTQRIHTLLYTSHLLNIDDLRIWFRPPPPIATEQKREEEAQEEEIAKPEIKAFWVLYIDILFISLDGNAFDAAWLSVLAALKDTKLPKAWWDGDRETAFCSDDPAEAKRLRLFDMPVALSFGVFEDDGKEGKKWILADMDGFEEALCREGGTVVVGEGKRIVKIEKSGGGGVGVKEMRGLVEAARVKREEWIGVLGKR